MDKTTQIAEVEFLLDKVNRAQHIPPQLRVEIDIMIKRVRRMARQGNLAEEYEAVAKYVDWCLRTPWNRYTQDNLDINNVKAFMDKEHYGLSDVKESILEYIAVIKKKTLAGRKDLRAPILAFAGPQGTGKTTIAMAIAHALGRPFVRISLGALSSSSEIRGLPKGRVDAEPGQIIKALAHASVLTPVILLDELDKVSGEQGKLKEFMAILLEILDPQQNSSFRDHYIDYPIDLSKVFFICTANTLETITKALLDRLEVIEFKDYTPEEKAIIGKNFLFKHVLDYSGLSAQELIFDDDVWALIVAECRGREGVRTLERVLERISRRVVKQIIMGQAVSVRITKENYLDYINVKSLGTQAYRKDEKLVGQGEFAQKVAAT